MAESHEEQLQKVIDLLVRTGRVYYGEIDIAALRSVLRDAKRYQALAKHYHRSGLRMDGTATITVRPIPGLWKTFDDAVDSLLGDGK